MSFVVGVVVAIVVDINSDVNSFLCISIHEYAPTAAPPLHSNTLPQELIRTQLQR